MPPSTRRAWLVLRRAQRTLGVLYRKSGLGSADMTFSPSLRSRQGVPLYPRKGSWDMMKACVSDVIQALEAL